MAIRGWNATARIINTTRLLVVRKMMTWPRLCHHKPATESIMQRPQQLDAMCNSCNQSLTFSLTLRGAVMSTAGPLARFKVIDLSRVRAGPTAVRQLADWGASV